jgi:hypothetical protein
MLRRFFQFRFVALAALSPFAVCAAPAYGSAEVVAVQPTRVADLVVLGAGFDSGFRQGMICRVTRGGAEIAEVILVDLRPTHSAGLIVALSPNQSIRSGDIASVKIPKV